MKVSTQKDDEGNNIQLVFILDRDQFIKLSINKQHNIFEKIQTVSLFKMMSLHGEWLKYYGKSSVNNEKIKGDFKLFNQECLGYQGEDYCVFKDINAGSACLIDA